MTDDRDSLGFRPPFGTMRGDHPSVSCICITQNRRFFLRRAMAYFEDARKEYDGQAELVILDGSANTSEEVLEDELWWGAREPNPHVHYHHEPSPPHAKTGALHNRACELAKGEIILQWDDDDFQAIDRIEKQAKALQAHPEGAFCFTSQFWWYHLVERRAARAISWAHGGSAGATFAYHRKTWEACPFRDVDQGEDSFFWQDHETRGTPMVDLKDPAIVVYIRHNQNGSHATNDHFTEEDTAACRAVLGYDAHFYDELSDILPLAQRNDPNSPWRAGQRLSYIDVQRLRAMGFRFT